MIEVAMGVGPSKSDSMMILAYFAKPINQCKRNLNFVEFQEKKNLKKLKLFRISGRLIFTNFATARNSKNVFRESLEKIVARRDSATQDGTGQDDPGRSRNQQP